MTARAPDPDRIRMGGSGEHGQVGGVGQVLLVERLEMAEWSVRTELLWYG